MLNDKLYVVGGWSGQTGLAKCEVYDPELKKWSPIESLKNGTESSKTNNDDIKNKVFHTK